MSIKDFVIVKGTCASDQEFKGDAVGKYIAGRSVMPETSKHERQLTLRKSQTLFAVRFISPCQAS